MHKTVWCDGGLKLADIVTKNIMGFGLNPRLEYNRVRLDFWEKSIKGKSINGLPMHAERAQYGVCRKKCFISYVHISYINSLVSIDTSV